MLFLGQMSFPLIVAFHFNTHSTFNSFFFISSIQVKSCEDLSCGTNEICVVSGDTYECVCHGDYEGENCQNPGLSYLIIS